MCSIGRVLRSGGWIRWGTCCYAAAVLACTAAWLLTGSQATERTGLRRELFLTNGFAAPPFRQEVSEGISLDFLDDDERLPRRHFAVRWSGYWYVPDDGPVVIHGDGDDRLNVHVDGDSALRCHPAQETHCAAGIVTLTAGVHELLVEYEQERGAYALDVQWSSTSGRPRPFAAHRLFHKPPSMEDVRLAQRARWLGWAATLLWAAPLLTLAGVGARRAWVACDRYGWASAVKPALLVLTPVCLLGVYWTRLDFTLLLDHVTFDDTFLYLQIVRNIADHGMVSFDGIHYTTGFQPLWVILLVPLAVVIEDRVEFVRWVLLLSVFLNLAAGLVMARLAAMLGGWSSGLITACLWGGYMLRGSTAMSGMESPLMALVFSGFLLSLFRNRAAPVAVAGLFLARTDALLFAPLASAFQARQALLRTAALSLLLVSPYLAFNLVTSGQLMPISGSVKMWWAGQDAYTFQDTASRLVATAGSIGGRVFPLSDRGVWTILFAVVLAIPVVIETTRLGETARRFFLALFACSALHIVACVVLLGRVGGTRWYFVPEYVAICLFIGVVLGRAKPRLVAGGVAVLLLFQMVQSHWYITEPRHSVYVERYEIARQIGRTLPSDAVIGAWNSGQLGYFAPQTVVNLDGLANDARYFNFLRDGGDVRDYLEEAGVEYIADYNDRDMSMPLDYDWDRGESFRGLWPLAELDVVLRGEGVLVFRLKHTVPEGR